MSTSAPPLNELVTKIRAAYPGAYDDMDDASLTKAVLAKYPQYSDLAAPKIKPPIPQMQQSNVGIALGSNADSPQNPMQPGEQWAIQNPGPALGAAGIGAVGAAGATLPSAVNAGASALIPYAPQIVRAAKIARDAGLTLGALKYLSKGDILGAIKKAPGK